MINLYEETLDELLFRLTQECIEEQKKLNSTSGGWNSLKNKWKNIKEQPLMMKNAKPQT